MINFISRNNKRGGFDKKILLLEVSDAPIKAKNPNLPENSGKPWTHEMDTILCEMYDQGASKKELCDYFKRTSGAIAALSALGKNRRAIRVEIKFQIFISFTEEDISPMLNSISSFLLTMHLIQTH